MKKVGKLKLVIILVISSHKQRLLGTVCLAQVSTSLHIASGSLLKVSGGVVGCVGFAHTWLRHPNRVAPPTDGSAIQSEWLRPQVATPPKQSGFAHRWLRHPNRVASPTGGYATEMELSTEGGGQTEH